jgi:hypothetical protein
MTAGMEDGEAFDSALLNSRIFARLIRSAVMRRVALCGLLICLLAGTLRAADNDGDRFVEAAKKLIQSINSGDIAAIEASYDTGMQQAFPPDKATPFFQGIVSGKGKLKDAGTPQVMGDTATMRVTAERGAWDFQISLDPAGKINGLLIKAAAGKGTGAGPAPAAGTAPKAGVTPAANATPRFMKVTNKLIQSINADDTATIEASFNATMQQALPTDKAKQLFQAIVSDTGKLKGAGAPQVTGDTAIMRVTAERGALDLKITLDADDRIAAFLVTPAAAAPGTPPVGSAPAANSIGSAVREWSDVKGKFHVKAELVGVKDGKVQLKTADGDILSVPLEKLSAVDQDVVKKMTPPVAAGAK